MREFDSSPELMSCSISASASKPRPSHLPTARSLKRKTTYKSGASIKSPQSAARRGHCASA
jgi:hypothetical protein